MFFDPYTAGASLAIGAVQSLVGFNQKQDTARQQNEQLMEDYKQRLRIRQQQIVAQDARYNLDTFKYKQTLLNLGDTANAAYQQEDLRLNELYKQAKFARQGENIALQQSLGRRAARGVSGKTAARMQAMDLAAYGRNQAIRAEQMFTSETASKLRKDAINRKLTSERQAAYADVAFAPSRPAMPLVPTQFEGPSSMSLLTDFASVGLDAFSQGAAAGRANEQLKSRNTLTDK